MLALCGINCADCAAYKATLTVDEEMMQKVIDTYGGGKGSFTDWVCLGCLHPEPRLIADYCAACEIRSCASEKGMASCALCSDYDGCEKLVALLAESDTSEATRARLNLLRQAFVARTSSEKAA
jgi:hypothetical protein